MQTATDFRIHHCLSKRASMARMAFRSLLLAAVSSFAQAPSVVNDANVYNRPVLLLGNDKLEVAIVKQGGSVLRIQIQGDPQGISPFGGPR